MNVEFIREPNLLLESIELVYRYVSGKTYEDVRNNIIVNYGKSFDDAQTKLIYDYTSTLSKIMKQACLEVNLRDECTKKLFSKLGNASGGNNMCIAKLMTFNFADISIIDLFDAADYINRKFHSISGGRYSFCGVRTPGFIEFAKLSPGDTKRSLMDQIDTFDLENQYKWETYKVLSEYDFYFSKLVDIIRPVAECLKTRLHDVDDVVEERIAFWKEYLEPHSVEHFVESQGNNGEKYVKDNARAIIWRVSCDELVADVDVDSPDWLKMFLGALIVPGAVMESKNIQIDMVQRSLQVLGNKKRLEILYLLKNRRLFGYEIARLVDLDATTVSRHMSALCASGLVTAAKGEGHTIYYTSNTNKIRKLLQNTGSLLVES